MLDSTDADWLKHSRDAIQSGRVGSVYSRNKEQLASVLTASRRVTAADHQKHRGVIEGRLRRTRVLFRCVPAAHGQYF